MSAITSNVDGFPGQGIAVVIPTHNRADLVALAINSALQQGPCVQEVIVVDDGSTDNTAEVVRQVQDPRVRLISQSQRGPSVARNAGWQASQSSWVQFVDSDDFLPAGSSQRLLSLAMRVPGSIPYGYEAIYSAQDISTPCFTARFAARDGWLREELCVWYQGTIFAALIPREALVKLGGFREDVHYGEDYDLAVRLGLAYPFSWVDCCTYAARMHPGNRHRESRAIKILRNYLFTVERNLSCSPDREARALASKAKSRWLCHFGSLALGEGAFEDARSCFLRAIPCAPLKRAAWRGLFASTARWRTGCPVQDP